ncbi:peroxide stress protein YaaA, partial [Thalassolituus sp. UBA1505]
NGKYKIISFYAKKARGLMTRWLIEKRIDSPAKLLQFDVAGYRFSEEESSTDTLVFKRAEKDLPNA